MGLSQEPHPSVCFYVPTILLVAHPNRSFSSGTDVSSASFENISTMANTLPFLAE